MHPGFVFALSWGYSLCSVCSLLGFHRFGSMRFDYERSYAMLLGALRKHLKNDCFALDPSKHFDYIVSIFSEGSLRRFFDYLDADISMMTVHSIASKMLV